MRETPRARLVAYGVAVLATAVSQLARWLLWPVLGDTVPHMTFFPAVMVAAYFGGFRPGLLATILSAIAANYLLTQQLSDFRATSANDLTSLILFVLTGVVISGLCESLHQARRRIAASERQRLEGDLRKATALLQAVADGTQDAVYVKDREGRHLMFNAAAGRMVGKPIADVLGRDDTAIFDRDSARAVMTHDRRVMESGVAATQEHELSVGGLARTYLLSKAPYRDGQGNVIGIIGIGHDITDRKRAEEALRQANASLDLAVRGSNLAIWECDMPDGRIENSQLTFINVWELMGYNARTPPTDFPSTFALLFHPDDQERVGRELQELFAGHGQEYSSEYRVRCKDGSTRWHLARGAVLRDPDGKPVRFIGTSADITNLKRAEEALRESERRWRNLTEALPQLVWSAMPDGSCDYFSAQWTEHTGVSEAELLGWRWLETLHPEDREPTRKYWLESVAEHHPYDIEYRVRRRDGQYRWFKTRGVPIRNKEGKVAKWFGTCTDITDLRQTEEALRLSEQRYRSLVEATTAIVFTMSASGLAESDQPSWSAFTGQSMDQYTGSGWLEAVHPDDRDRTLQLWSAAVAARSFCQIEYRVRRHDGEYRNLLERTLPIVAEDGELREWFGTGVDITDLKRAEQQLHLARDAAEAANQAKDEFLANVSHEIRTPMNAILGMTELALDTTLADDQRQYLTTVKSAADSLLGLINDLLDFSKIEAGKLELDSADFSLRASLGDALRALAVRAHRKGLELISHVRPDVPDALVGDAARLRQVLLNLVGNAIKFTEAGEVAVTVERASQNAERQNPHTDPEPDGAPRSALCAVRFTVRDTGIGIPREQQGRIFRAFEQEDASTTRRYGGTGLGLSIASRLVALMNGTITVESVPGRGSTFGFTAWFGLRPHAPEAVAGDPLSGAPVPALLRGLRVLVVDDNVTNRHILEEWLRGWRMEPAAVGDGLAALDALRRGAAGGRPYALVLLDARMPDTDGLTLAAMIREKAELSATRIVLLTSGDRLDDRARLRELRIDADLLKPVQQDELLETIHRVMSRAGGEEPAPQQTPARETAAGYPLAGRRATPLHILVAEDNEFSARLLEQLLVRRGHRVRQAADGREALALAFGRVYDLLLLDVHMPELDGFQVVRAIREREQAAGGHLPIIALTARSREEDRDRCLAAGMDDFLTKPVPSARLYAAIDRLICAHGVSRPPRGDAGAATSLLDPVAVLTACGDDADGLISMCRDLRTYAPAGMAEVTEALRDGDAPRLREAAHKLCSLLSAFSTAAGDVASDLEDRAAQGHLDARPPVERLEAMVGELMPLVDGLSIETLRHQVGEAGGRGRVDEH